MNVRPSRIAVHIALILYTILALGPIVEHLQMIAAK